MELYKSKEFFVMESIHFIRVVRNSATMNICTLNSSRGVKLLIEEVPSGLSNAEVP